MTKCFVIQPFDKAKFDKRYEDVFVPAIREAGLEPYRVDQDPAVTIPIDQIRTGIEAAVACLAEISTDNPNVWFELGFAIASQKEVVLVCSKERASPFPFDVQHRSIVSYTPESSSDFIELRTRITSRLNAIRHKKESMEQVAQIPSVAKLDGLEQYEIATLVAVTQQMDDPFGGASAYQVREDMEEAGFNKLATNLGLRALMANSMLQTSQERDIDGSFYTAYQVTDSGLDWLLANKDKLALKCEPLTKN